jgi:hypothetical protein
MLRKGLGMQDDIIRSFCTWAVLISSIDQLFSKSRFKEKWIPPTKGFNILRCEKAVSDLDVIKSALECSRSNNLIDKKTLALSTCDTIIHPADWPQHCVIGLGPIKFKKDVTVLDYCELNFEPVTLSRVVKIPFSAKFLVEKTVLQLLTEHLPKNPVKINKFKNVFGKNGKFIAFN